jgi:methionyl-tRNA formyltransferase
MLKIIFFGTPQYTLPILESLHKTFKERHESPIVAVVTQKPKPAGRKHHLKYSAIDNWAYEKKVPIFFESGELVKRGIKADIGILAAYGEIIPKTIIEYFPYGILNVHPSLLPLFRGASPVQAAIIADGKKTGSTIIQLDEKLDHGSIVNQFTEKIKRDDTTKTLRYRLFKRSAEVLKTLIPAYIKGKVNLVKQEDDKATYTTTIKKDDAFIDPSGLNTALNKKRRNRPWEIPFIKNYSTTYSPEIIERFIRAMKPWPVAWSKIKIDQKELRIKLIKAHIEKDSSRLVLKRVQLEGKNPVSWKQFIQGYPKATF